MAKKDYIQKVVNFKRWKCYPSFGRYDNDGVAIVLRDWNTDELIAKATINIPNCPMDDDEVIIKDYGENEGILIALIDAGIVQKTDKKICSGFIVAPIVNY